MVNENIGTMIQKERTRQQLSLEDLCHGLCRKSTLFKLENEGKLADYLTFSALLTRLGRNTTTFKLIFMEEEFQERMLQLQIEEELMHHNYSAVEELWCTYENISEQKYPAQKQYALFIQGILAMERDGQPEKALELLEEAMAATQSSANDAIEGKNPLWSKMEWMIYMYQLQILHTLGKPYVFQWCRQGIHLLEQRPLDPELHMDLFSKMVWLLGLCGEQETNKDTQLFYTKSAVDELLFRGRLTHLVPLLKQQIRLYKELGHDTEVGRWQKQLDALLLCYEMVDMPLPSDNICMWRQYQENDIFLFSEVVRRERLASDMTQGDLAIQAGTDYKTISRIERGIVSPKRGTLHNLWETLGLSHNLYGTDIYTDDFDLLDLADQANYDISGSNPKKVQNLLNILEVNISRQIPVNLQFLQWLRLWIAEETNAISKNDYKEGLIAAFEITRKFDIPSFSKICLSQQETILATNIARCERETGNEGQAILILESMLQGFDSSKVPDELHSGSLKMILGHLKDYCETHGDLDKAESYCLRDWKLQLKCDRGKPLALVILQWFYIQERKKAPSSIYKEGYQQAYQIFLLMKREKEAAIIISHYKHVFGEDLK